MLRRLLRGNWSMLNSPHVCLEFARQPEIRGPTCELPFAVAIIRRFDLFRSTVFPIAVRYGVVAS